MAQEAQLSTRRPHIVELVILLPGQQAAEMRCMAARIIVRFLGGDTSLVEEVCSIRKFQEHLASNLPEDPRRLFGEAVEATVEPMHAIVQFTCATLLSFTWPKQGRIRYTALCDLQIKRMYPETICAAYTRYLVIFGRDVKIY